MSCLIEAHKNAVIQYSCWSAEPFTLDLAEDGEYCLVQVPGNGIVTTFYHRDGGGKNDSEKKQVRKAFLKLIVFRESEQESILQIVFTRYLQ